MNRLLISLCVFVTILFACNVVSVGQQGPVYASQAGQPYDQSQYGYRNNNQYGDNQQNNGQYGNNNNWSNQYDGNNDPATNPSYNNQYGSYNNQNNNNRQNNSNNPFLKNYARKSKRFSATVCRLEKGKNKLSRPTTLDSKSLKKAVVIFFGDWCPNCARFLTGLSKYLNQLVQDGIRIIFIGVPSPETLQDWKSPTITDYNSAKDKLRSYNIVLEQLDPKGYDSNGNPKSNNRKVELVLLGDEEVLNKNAIDSLPTMLVIRDSNEQFRGSSDNSLDIVNFESPSAMQQFKEIWNEEDEDDEDDDDDRDEDEDDDDDEEEEATKAKKKSKDKKKSVIKKNKSSNKKKTTNIKLNNKPTKKKSTTKLTSKSSKVDDYKAEFHTRMLNKGCQYSCNNNLPPLIKQQYVAPVRQPIVTNISNAVQPAEEEPMYIIQKRRCIRQRRPVMCCKPQKNNDIVVSSEVINNNPVVNQPVVTNTDNNRCHCTCD